MKPLILMMALVLVMGYANAQKIDASKVPEAVKTAFAKQNPAISNVKWEMEHGKYEAGFKKEGHSMSALYEPNGTMTESEMEIKVADLPASVKNYVKDNYKGKNIKEAAKITKADGSVNYEAEVNGVDLIFDTNGKFLKADKE